MLMVPPETQVSFSCVCILGEEFVAGETGNEEFWACLSTLILQLTGRQRRLRREHSDVRSWVQSPGVVPRSGTLPSLNSVNDFRECRG